MPQRGTKRSRSGTRIVEVKIPDDTPPELRERAIALHTPPYLLHPATPTLAWEFGEGIAHRIDAISSAAQEPILCFHKDEYDKPYVDISFVEDGMCVVFATGPIVRASGTLPIKIAVAYGSGFRRSGGNTFEFHADMKRIDGQLGRTIEAVEYVEKITPMPNIFRDITFHAQFEMPGEFLLSFVNCGPVPMNSTFQIRAEKTDPNAQLPEGKAIVFVEVFGSPSYNGHRRLLVDVKRGSINDLDAVAKYQYSPRVLNAVRSMISVNDPPIRIGFAYAPCGDTVVLAIQIELSDGMKLRTMLVPCYLRQGNTRRAAPRTIRRVEALETSHELPAIADRPGTRQTDDSK